MATKVSEITKEEVAAYLRLDDASSSDLQQIDELKLVAVSFIKSQTGLDDAGLDLYPDLIIVVKILCQDMYDNRTLYVDTQTVNKTVEAILGSHRQNFLPSATEANPDNAATITDTSVTVSPLDNDMVAFGSVITSINGTAAETGTPITVPHGTATLAADGSVTIAPETGYVGTIAFNYEATAPDSTTTTSMIVVVISGAA
jgi:hypothetical protein